MPVCSTLPICAHCPRALPGRPLIPHLTSPLPQREKAGMAAVDDRKRGYNSLAADDAEVTPEGGRSMWCWSYVTCAIPYSLSKCAPNAAHVSRSSALPARATSNHPRARSPPPPLCLQRWRPTA